MTEQTLNEFWNFEDADLAANRFGSLTEKQKTYLTGEHKTQSNVFLGVGAFVVVLFLCIPALLIGGRLFLPLLLAGDLEISSFLPAGLGLGFLTVFAVPVVLVLGIYVMRSRKQADLTIKKASGRTGYSWGTKRVRNPGNKARPYDDIPVLHLSLGDKKFEVHKDLQNIIHEGEDWTIYYTSYPFKFLSGEKNS